MTIDDLYRQAMEAKALYNAGAITREEARSRVRPYELRFNEKSRELAAKYRQKAKLFSFAAFMR
jgi:hypothetical protein